MNKRHHNFTVRLHTSAVLCVVFALMVGGSILVGRVLRANAPEIAYLQSELTAVGAGDLILLDVERGIEHPLVRGMQVTTFDWSPDGTRLAFVALAGRPQLHLYLLTLDGGTPQRLTNRTVGSEDAPAWSPDGKRLAYITMGESTALEILDFTSGETTRLTTGDFVDTRLAWSPDGCCLAYATGRMTQRNIFVVDVSTSQREQLTLSEGRISSAVWSPDGCCLAYRLHSNIYLLSVRADESRVVTASDHVIYDGPVWSPDGNWMYFIGGKTAEEHLYMISIDGGTPRQVTPVSGVYSLHFSPDGAAIAITRLGYGTADVLIVNREGGQPRQVTSHALSEWYPVWRP